MQCNCYSTDGLRFSGAKVREAAEERQCGVSRVEGRRLRLEPTGLLPAGRARRRFMEADDVEFLHGERTRWRG